MPKTNQQFKKLKRKVKPILKTHNVIGGDVTGIILTDNPMCGVNFIISK